MKMCLKKRASFYLNLELKYWSSKLESSADMPNYCVAVGCKNMAKKGSEYSFHHFPHQNPNLLKKWVHAIRRKQWKPTKHSFICSDHFHESCFVIRPGAEAIANAKQASKQAIWYNEHTKQFALTQHYYSPRAYDFVHQVLLLPHPSCIWSWAASVDCEPGFLCDIISFLTASFTPTSKVSWKVEAFSLCMFLLLPTLREVPHGMKGTGPKFVMRPVYSRSQLRNNANTVSVLVLLMHLFHTLYTRYAGIAHHQGLQTSGRG